MRERMEQCLKKALPFWGELPQEDQQLLTEQSVQQSFRKGETIFNPLKKMSGLRIIENGRIRISIQTANGGEMTLYQLGTGEVCILSIFSQMGQFDWDIYVDTVQDSQIIVIPEPVYLLVSARNPVMAAYNHEALVTRLGEIVQTASHRALASSEEKLAALLLRYMEMTGMPVLTVTHEGLAKDIGTAREVVSRTLKQFEREGCVRLGRGELTILDQACLERLKRGKKQP